MPWHVEKCEGDRPWKIIKDATGDVVGTSATREAAEASIRARYADEEARKNALKSLMGKG